jgi:hypothetical protein
MTSPHARNPQASLTAHNATQIQRYQVVITAIDYSKAGQSNSDAMGIAQTTDTFGKLRQIGVSTMVGSGAYPQVGETWVIDKSLGTWTFLSRVAPIIPHVTDVFSLALALQQLGILFMPPSGIKDQIQVLAAAPDNPTIGQQYYDSTLQGSFVWNGTWWMEQGFITPIGGVIYANQFPTTTTSYASGNTVMLTATVPMVQGWQYTATLTCIQATQITAASATAVQIFVRDSMTLIPNSTGLKAFIQTSMAINQYTSGSQTIPIVPTASGTDTFTVTASTGASSLQVAATTCALIIIRTA